eukprot:TRINITY_DN24720_c0_g1_i1.p1 TRINITY_DN24720_c0_g1~~TRINITY_DN24720_c0_g1_i1.p1  ORF type:complete len:328 (-),score=51.04 TRINITY_DN24720_c0_g1_i1:227-1210(-)
MSMTTAAKALLSCGFFCAVGPMLIFLNKLMLQWLPCPIFLTLCGMVFSSAISAVLCTLGFAQDTNCQAIGLGFYLRNVMPIGALIGVTIWQGNMAYMYLSVSYIQMVKAWTPMMVVVIGAIVRWQSPSRRVLVSVLVLVLGTSISSYGELSFSLAGFLCILASCMCEAIRSVMQEKLLVNHSFGVVEGIMIIYPAAALFLAIMFYFFEMDKFSQIGGSTLVLQNKCWVCTAALLGFLVNFASALVIKFCSSLTLKVLASARNAAVVLVAAVYLHEATKPHQLLGYGITIAGFALYQAAPKPAKPDTRVNPTISPVVSRSIGETEKSC